MIYLIAYATILNVMDRLMSWAKYSTIRQGSRNINGMAGSEKLVKWQGKRYLFIWEKDDGSGGRCVWQSWLGRFAGRR